jgi:HK97 family phage prohead protease
MPLPSPNAGETESHFINRCMANPTMNEEYPDPSQRRAVCQSQWDRHREILAQEHKQDGFEIQTLIFPKKFWDTADQCKKWLEDHGFKTNIDETGESFRAAQRNSGDFVRLRTICLSPDRDTPMDDCRIKAVGGPLKGFDMPELILLERHDWVTKVRDDRTYDRAPLRKGFVCDKAIRSLDAENRTFEIIISSGILDRDRDTLNPRGWDLKSYKENPVVHWAHDHRIPAIARSTKTFRDGDFLVGTPKFPEEGIHPFADMIYNLVLAEIIRAASVGFNPIEYKFNDDTGGVDFIKQELLEWSLVNVPANPEALIRAKQLGIDITPMRDWALQALDTFSDGGGIWLPRKDLERILKIVEHEKCTVLVNGFKFTESGEADSGIITLDVPVKAPDLKKQLSKLNMKGIIEEIQQVIGSDTDYRSSPPPVSPEENIIMRDVDNCARCEERHENMGFVKLTRPCGEFTHWTRCPVTDEPIMMTIKEGDEPKEDAISEATGIDVVLALLGGGTPSPGLDLADSIRQALGDSSVTDMIRESVKAGMTALTGKLD